MLSSVISIIGLIGIGGLLKSLLDYYLNKNKSQKETQQQLKEKRYMAIILLSYTFINFEQEKDKLRNHRPDIKTFEDLKKELMAEIINMSLYAADQTVQQMKSFLQSPSNETFAVFILEMRKELFGIKTTLKPNDFRI